MIEPTDEMLIDLGGGLVAVLDGRDAPLIAGFHWHSKPGRHTTYAQAHRTLAVGRYSTIMMHRLILGEPDSAIDHVNGDGLDNRRANLRLANFSQNGANSGLQRNNRSGFKGVHWDQKHRRWVAEIRVHGKKRYLGGYLDAESAARSYDAAALEHFGSFAQTNFPRSS